ncbi:hypothetical protein SBOR_9232 [Sclerotinia borealis F-4128]|uniref:Uncharacterized protein n=1 Tax=Sclerotinia borealis (strain F-4128) TaxID=1432307 RepID=W9C3F5_SCLBF|nr:hypothetical protein SBOR_9232 [Sclerotinia borealis F-4128]
MSSLHRELLTKKKFNPFMIADMVATERMEKRKAMEITGEPPITIGQLQHLFRDIVKDALPEKPHILKIPDAAKKEWEEKDQDELPKIPWNLRVLSEHVEARKLQYMTVFSSGDRDLQVPQSFDHEDHTHAARNTVDTPRRDPNKTMSWADYNKMKKEGIKPALRTSAAPDLAPPKGHTRTTSSTSNATPIARGSSFEGAAKGEIQKNGTAVHSASKAEQVVKNGIDRNSNPLRSNPTKPQHLTNGTNGIKIRTEQTKDVLRPREINTPQVKSSTKPSSSIPTWDAPLKHSLPPRPQSPRRVVADNRNHKRPLEAEEPSHAEKRARTDRANSHLQKIVKPENISSKAKAPPSNLSKSDDHASKFSKGTGEIKSNKLTGKPVNNLPPLLSPLPADLTTPTTFDGPKKADQKASSSSTPSKFKPSLSGKKLPLKESSLPQGLSPNTPPTSVSPFQLPPLLSPTLPDIVEAALAEHKEKSDKQKESDKPISAPEHRQEKSGLLTVEERHTQARKPDAPGVARKTTTGAKIGHPPKRSASSTPLQKDREVSKAPVSSQSLIVKLPYSKKNATTIERLLRLSPRPSPEFLKLDAIRKKDGNEVMMALGSSKKVPVVSTKTALNDSGLDSEEDIPLSSQSKKTVSKKRPSDVLPLKSEPPSKRAKGPDSLDVTTSRKTVPSPLKTPMRPGTSQKSLLATPKKSEGSRAAMVRVTSSDGNPQTPQGANITATTPQSVSANKSELIREFARKLKKKGERMTRVGGDQHQLKPVTERSAGVMVVFECICLYMRYFKGLPCASPKETSYNQKGMNANNWEGILPMLNWLGGISKDIPVLQALFAHLNAVCQEECTRAFFSMRPSPGNAEDDRAKDNRNWSKQQACDSRRHEAWRHSNFVGYKLLRNFSLKGEPTVVGPWTSVGSITTYCMEVCTAFNKKEKLGWEKDVDF